MSETDTPRTRAPRPLVLMILDGWGVREDADDNAIARANTPAWDALWRDAPHALLDTSGEAVGLPAGQMGNSEVGHMNIGAGRIVYQDFTRITKAIEDGSFFDNGVLCGAIDAAVEAGGAVHVMGLLSPGGVHSHEDHYFATLDLARRRGAKRVWAHAFLDGRDMPPRSAEPSLQRLDDATDDVLRVASVTGRYFAMDRDQRWNRVERAWDAVVQGRGAFAADSGQAALEAAYRRDENDEFVQPTVVDDYPGVRDGDTVIFVNFRADRARQLSRAFVEPGFDGFERDAPRLAAFVGMTEYLEGLPADVAFPPEALRNGLGETLAKHGLKQLRIAETEKYAHVTFFL
ncbi:MAG: 2,3-bisphosphoglycerate-independent phosphoglycerate mutase, partial [Xanthomonadales bacterium]|nr:2,3-bisphosphoglycerate-independent phosphoglycerate mutase [Xanthomonadales bacterium]